jgi:hypothetical protein
MSNSGPRSQRGGQQRRFRDLFASGVRTPSCASVHIEALRALSCACHRNRDQFAVPSGDSATVPPNGLIELYERGEFRWREPLEFAQLF